MFGKPYFMREESYQVWRVTEPQRRLADPGDMICKTSSGDLVGPFPWIRNERRQANPGNNNYKAGDGDLVRPFPRIRNKRSLADPGDKNYKADSGDLVR